MKGEPLAGVTSPGYDVARMRWLLFEHAQGAYDVDVAERECSCKEPSCSHLAVVKDLVDCKARDFRQTVRRSFHRAIRRRDPITALRWARWYEALHGEHAVKRFCAEILLQETRNVRLHLEWQKMRHRSVTEMVTALVCSRKAWELPVRHQAEAYRFFLKGFADSKGIVTECPVTAAQIRRDIKADSHRGALFWTMWRVFQSPKRFELEEVLKEALRDKAAKHGGLVHQVAKSKWYASGSTIQTLIEMLDHGWSEEANEVVCKPDPLLDPAPVVPLAEGLDDRRWADSFLSMLWRETAFAQFGSSYKNQSWDSVHMDGDLMRWAEHAKDMDVWNRPRLIRS